MENLIISFNTVLPIFLTILLGYGLKKMKLYDDHAQKIMNNLVFKLFLPMLLFNNIYKTKLENALNYKLLIFSAVGLIIVFAVLCVIIPIIEKENKKRGVMIQGIYRSNYVILGLPITASLYSESELGAVSVAAAVVVPIYNILAVIALEIFRGREPDFKKMMKGIVKNPLIISSTIGIIFLNIGIKLPVPLEKTIGDFAKAATPLAIFLLGGSFEFEAVGKHMKSTVIAVVGKLVLIPLLIMPICILLGFRGVELLTLFLIFGAPTAVSSFTMAQQMDGDSELAGQIVVFTSLLCILSIFMAIFILKEMAFI